MALKDFIKANKHNQEGITGTLRRDKNICEISDSLLINEFDNGVPKADGCDIPELSRVFSWKRGFQNTFTGYPNEGKTEFTLFLMTIKALNSGWKWVFWSPEMKSASFINGKVEVHYNDLINQIISIVSGKPVYKHIADKYNLERISKAQYLTILAWVKEHFICLDPVDNHIDNIYDCLRRLHDKEGYDGILIDPFKNVRLDDGGRDDQKLDVLFTKFKDLAVRTNTVMNWIAHPKANVQRELNGVRLPCTQYMLLGGAAWDNNMDGIYSIFRHDLLNDPRSPYVTFLNLKQRKQDLTTERGTFGSPDNMESLELNLKTKRYLFNDRDVVQAKF